MNMHLRSTTVTEMLQATDDPPSVQAETKRIGKNRIEVRLNNPFLKGRGRINCTMAGKNNRWRWLGRQFIIK